LAGFTLDVASVALQVGDWFCTSPADPTGATVTKAVAAALAVAGAPLAIAIESAQPGQAVRGIPVGMVPNAITGLGAGSVSAVKVNTTTARSARVASPVGTDYLVGIADTAGG